MNQLGNRIMGYQCDLFLIRICSGTYCHDLRVTIDGFLDNWIY
jgi:hypothetical protein